jgi:tetratricopeptide (TPR) repeat protein
MIHQKIGSFGPHKREIDPWASPEERRLFSRDMLARALNLRTTVAFLGSGCSSPLGYPNWTKFTQATVSKTVATLEQLFKETPTDARLEKRLGFFRNLIPQVRAALRNPRRVDSKTLTYMLGACQKAFKICNKVDDYHALLKGQFERKSGQSGTAATNPYEKLLELNCIRRFITTNYDYEIEWALHRMRKINKTELGLHDGGGRALSPGEVRRSFTHQDLDPLALFAMARVDEAENLVFHCHGVCSNPETMVVTEEDYQKYYLSDSDSSGAALRQTLEVLFSSNPILFIGFGLRDDDILRPLRTISAADPERKATRPLFALLPQQDDEHEEEEEFEQLFDRYGVHVIQYPVPESARNNDQRKGEALCEALDDIRKDWIEGRAEWLKKPVIREVKIGVDRDAGEPYYHYAQKACEETKLSKRSERILNDIEKDINNGARLIALVGPGGTGKSWHALRLMERLIAGQAGEKRYAGFFFWSSYYADDSLTGLDRALCYMAPQEERRRRPRLERLLDCLRNEEKRYFLIFDGVERFLRESNDPRSKDPAIGKASTMWIDTFFQRLADEGSKSTVIITSRLWPAALQEGPGICRKDVPRLTTDDVKEIEPFDREVVPHSEVSALCSLLAGHIYGLVLAAEMLKAAWDDVPPPAEGTEEDKRLSNHKSILSDLKRALSGTSPDHRVSKMIEVAITAVDKHQARSGLALEFLQRLAIFMSPVRSQTVSLCYALAMKGVSEDLTSPSNDPVNQLVEKLVSRKLLFRVYPTPSSTEDKNNCAYTVHPTVRGYVFQRIHRSGTDALPNFTLPGFTAGTAVVDPGSEQCVEIVESVFNSLCEHAEEEIAKPSPEEKKMARILCRDAFGVVRSRMESNTVPRWGNYDKYIRYLLRLTDLIKTASPKVWDYAEQQSLKHVEDKQGVLYADELAWLYNEIGLTYYSQSAMLDALAVWEQEYEINHIIESTEGGGHYQFQALCNLGAANIHFGRLNIAEEYFRSAEKINFKAKDEDHKGRILGYKALVQHLRGNLTEAESLYRDALKILRRVENHRAASIFYRHQSDLQIQRDRVGEAEQSMLTSRALAEAANYPELVAYVRLTSGHIYRKRENLPNALLEYNAALSEARRIGIRRLEAEALSELARLALNLGDTQVARQRAIESLKIANEFSLGLRQTHGLVLLGLASIKGGQRNLGAAYLKHAKKMADQQHYSLRGREAEEELRLIGEM